MDTKASIAALLLVGSSLVCRGQLATYICRQPQSTDTYFQTITYQGDQREFCAVSTFLKDSTLYRIDSYRIAGPQYTQTVPLSDQIAATREGSTKIMYPNGQVYLSCLYHYNRLDGPLLLYYSDGALKRRELYRKGALKESHCYTPQGTEQPYRPLYQPILFNGSYKTLTQYIEKKVQPIIDRTGATDAQIQLTINELGQVVDVLVNSHSKANDDDLIASIRAVIQAIPQQVPNQLNWKPARMDDVPLTEIQRVFITKRRGFIYVNIPPSTSD